MEMGGIFLKNLELYPPPPLQLGSGEYGVIATYPDNGNLQYYCQLLRYLYPKKFQ